MEIKWTSEQRAAVTAPVSNLLVTAAAGSGKTQVLTGRIIRHILEGGDISRLLIVTFTRAAAAEMRERITKNISDALKEQPNNAHLRNQIALLGAADINTIHSFCLNIVKTRALEAGINPSFKIADNIDVDFMKEEAAGIALEKMYSSENKDFIRFAKAFGGEKSDQPLIDIILSVYKFSQSMPYPLVWLSDMKERYFKEADMPFADTETAKQTIKNITETIEGLCSVACSAADMLDYETAMPYRNMFLTDANNLKRLLTAKGWDELRDMLLSFTFDRAPIVKNIDEQTKERVSETRKSLKKSLESLAGDMPFSESDSQQILKYNSVFVDCLCETVKVFDSEYKSIKEDKNLLDLNDIEHLTIKILENEQTATEIMEKYDEIYIDEYQDSNETQELIFSRISRSRLGTPNIFMVGDLKQSIYGFRQTSPKLFLDKKKCYSTAEDATERKISLSRNFRSRNSVIDFVNLIFSKIMSEEAGGTSYDSEEALVAAAPYDSDQLCHKPEINIIETDTDDDESIDKAVAEARFVASKIHEIKKGYVYDTKKGESRQMKYSDIVILMRSPSSVATVFEEELLQSGIPVYADTGTGYYQTTEIRTFLSLLSVIDNPVSDIPLIAVLRSPIFGFSEEELAQIRLCSMKTTFKKAVDSAALLDNSLGEKCREFLKKLRVWRRRASYMPADELIWYLFEDTGYMDFAGALPSGETRKANLRLLFEKARKFEESSFRGLFNFLEFVQKSQIHEDLGSARLIGEGQDVVRIMSIHKSKGLEFPVVFLCQTGKGFNKKDLSAPIILNKKLGFGLKYIDDRLMLQTQSPDRIALRIQNADDSMSEEIRVLYVALTRAKEKLIITGALCNAEQKISAWALKSSFLSPRNVLSAKSFLELISICLGSGQNKDVGFHIIQPLESEKSVEETDLQKIVPTPPSDELIKRLQYVYPHNNLTAIPSKVSVTELKRIREHEDSTAVPLYKIKELSAPKFIEKQKITPAMRGTYTHFVLQMIDLKTVSTPADVESFLNSLVEQNILTAEAAQSVSCKQIADFANSPLGKRIKNADKIFKETPFTIPLPASYLTKNTTEGGESVILQGIIDCFFFEGDKIVLVDFKTDAATGRKTIMEKYKLQMDLYALALEKKYFLKIYEKFIYLLSNNDIIEME